MIEPKAWLYAMEDGAELLRDERAKSYPDCWTETALYHQSAIDELQAENERLRAENARLKRLHDRRFIALAAQYRDDLRRPPTGDRLERRLSAITRALEASHD